jgi:dsRNA-specific ribonuclease
MNVFVKTWWNVCFYKYNEMILLCTFEETHKSYLMEFIRKSQMEPPVFEVQNEGPDHAPEFWCTLFVGGKAFTPRETFRCLKESEHEASKLALEYLTGKYPPQPSSFLLVSPRSNKFLFWV